ncbi:MAG TPA: thiosulfate oxidation carrier protein SoxY [Rhodocyclaceae bacterium]|nr:thiosulfate oxidation carrier protein SoxY [Rhodocyclaceae bacterium]
MNPLRRKLLKGGTAAAALLPLLGAGLLVPGRALAAPWNRTTFTARGIGDALKAYGAQPGPESRNIVISAPEIAENGAKVEVEITSNLPDSRSIALFSDKNPMPLCAAIEFGKNAVPFCRLQVKLAETTRVRAVVRTGDGKTHIASREIKVTLGGCGG